MQNCINDNTKSFNGTEASPKGHGYASSGEDIGVIKKGLDGKDWIVILDKNNIKRWVKHKSNNIELNFLTLEMFFQLTVIPPYKVYNYLNKNAVMTDLKKKIIPVIKSNNIKFYIVPLPLSNNNIYWSDYAHSYLNKFYGDEYLDYNYLEMTVYMHNNLELNLNKKIVIRHNLTLEQSQYVYDIFLDKLPYNFEWNCKSTQLMKINYQKNEYPIQPKIIEETNIYPQICVSIKADVEKKFNKKYKINIYNDNPFTDSYELDKLFDEIEKISDIMDTSYDYSDKRNYFRIDFTTYSITDINIINKIKQLDRLTFDNFVLKITELEGWVTLDQNNELKLMDYPQED